MNNPHIGSSLDDMLREDGTLDAINARAQARVDAWLADRKMFAAAALTSLIICDRHGCQDWEQTVKQAIAAADTMIAEMGETNAQYAEWSARYRPGHTDLMISPEAIDEALQGVETTDPQADEIDRLRALLVAAVGPCPPMPGWPDEEWKRAEMMIRQRESWTRQERD